VRCDSIAFATKIAFFTIDKNDILRNILEMDKWRNWLKARADAMPYGEKGRLASAMGIEATMLSRILSGKRELKIAELENAAVFFGEPTQIGPTAIAKNSSGPLKARQLNENAEARYQGALAKEAQDLGIDLDAVIAEALKVEKQRRWKEENRAAIEAANAWVETHGLPLEKHRVFGVG
jgi:antitoxin CcdA